MDSFYINPFLRRVGKELRDYVEERTPDLERSYQEDSADQFSDKISDFFNAFPGKLTMDEREAKARLRNYLYKQTLDKRAREISRSIEARKESRQ